MPTTNYALLLGIYAAYFLKLLEIYNFVLFLVSTIR